MKRKIVEVGLRGQRSRTKLCSALERSKPCAEYVSKSQRSIRGPQYRSRAVGLHRVAVELVRSTSRRRTMLKIDQKREITGLEHVASHHWVTLGMPGWCQVMLMDLVPFPSITRPHDLASPWHTHTVHCTVCVLVNRQGWHEDLPKFIFTVRIAQRIHSQP